MVYYAVYCTSVVEISLWFSCSLLALEKFISFFYFKNVKKIKIKYALLPIPFHYFRNHNFMNNISLKAKSNIILYFELT